MGKNEKGEARARAHSGLWAAALVADGGGKPTDTSSAVTLPLGTSPLQLFSALTLRCLVPPCPLSLVVLLQAAQ